MYLGDVCTVPVNIAGIPPFPSPPCGGEFRGRLPGWHAAIGLRFEPMLYPVGTPMNRRKKEGWQMSVKDAKWWLAWKSMSELKTATKISAAAPTAFGAEPNTQCCPVCTECQVPAGIEPPGGGLRHAVRALRPTAKLPYIPSRTTKLFYPDLPKAYQISHYDLPLCGMELSGYRNWMGARKRIGITRIHIEVRTPGSWIHLLGKGTFGLQPV